MSSAQTLPPAPARASRVPRAEVRDRVLAAAEQVFATHGFAGARIEEIAAQAGFSKGAVYSNFADKDDLFLALLERQVALRITIAEEVLSVAGGQGPQAVARELARQLSALLREDPDWIPLLLGFWADSVQDPARLTRLESRRGPLRDALAAIITDWTTAAGITLALTPQEMALAATALVNGLAVEQLAHPETVAVDLLERILALVLEPVT